MTFFSLSVSRLAGYPPATLCRIRLQHIDVLAACAFLVGTQRALGGEKNPPVAERRFGGKENE